MEKKTGVIDKKDIIYEVGGIELLEFVSPLWNKLNSLHKEKSKDFKERYNSFTFEDRKKSLIIEEKEIMVVLVKNIKLNKYIGYSISSISKDSIGEIDSIYVDSSYRGLQIGDVLMNKPLEWMHMKDLKKIIIGVASGNEDVFPFYRKFGFYPKVTILEKL